jgi:hypothetical protein
MTRPPQPSLFDANTPSFNFDGATYEPERDQIRLNGQMLRVFDVMRDGQWRTLSEIRLLCPHDSEAGISARLRDLRKAKFGGWTVERRARHERGLFEYRLIIPW